MVFSWYVLYICNQFQTHMSWWLGGSGPCNYDGQLNFLF